MDFQVDRAGFELIDETYQKELAALKAQIKKEVNAKLFGDKINW